jgi:hypothetical protein
MPMFPQLTAPYGFLSNIARGRSPYREQRQQREDRVRRNEVVEAERPAMRDLGAQNVSGRAADVPGAHQQRKAHGGGAGRRCPDGELHDGEERDVEQYAAREMDDERRAV